MEAQEAQEAWWCPPCFFCPWFFSRPHPQDQVLDQALDQDLDQVLDQVLDQDGPGLGPGLGPGQRHFLGKNYGIGFEIGRYGSI